MKMKPKAAFVIGCSIMVGIGLWLTLLQWANELPGYADLRVRGHYREFFLEMIQTAQNLGLNESFVARAAGLALAIAAATTAATSLDTSLPDQPPQGDGRVVAFPLDVSALAVVLAVVAAGLVALIAALTLIRWSEIPMSQGANSPQRLWRADRALTGVRVAVLGLTSAFVASGVTSVVAGMLTGPGTALKFGGAAASLGVVGALFAVFMGDHHAWLAHHAATALLAARGRLPYHLLAFLDDAHRLGLLRVVGPVYQFRHGELQDHLTSQP